ncbi:ECF transporter S component [Nocardioides sp. YIM 152588]|uniref:ECF transporter S component n=1 Tax=Nocardioides sp. YIM 152588 TaxID=3158259 RepID=UPI0032E3F995
MGETEPWGRRSAGKFDDIAVGLQQMRAAAGNPSYAEIVRTIGEHRRGAGGTNAFGVPGRTTVYDAFRTGRRRVDPALVGEIVRALGGDDETVAAWQARCVAAAGGAAAAASPTVEVPAAGTVDPAAGLGADVPEPPAPVAGPEEVAPGTAVAVRRLPARVVVAVLAGAIAVNLLGRLLADFLDVPLYLDMAGTAFVAIALGPWWGAGVGAATNLVRGALIAPTSLPFAVCNVAGALLWGYGVRRYGLHRSVPRFLLLCVGVAVVCTVLATPILVYGFHGHTQHGSDRMTDTFLGLHVGLLVSVFGANLLASLIDKVLSGFVALGAAEAMVGPIPVDRGAPGGAEADR